MAVEYTRATERDLQRLPAGDVETIIDAITKFDTSNLGSVKKLHGQRPPMWRLRSGDYRVLFRRVEGAIHVERVLARKDAYR